MEEDRKGFLTVVEALKLVGLLHQIPIPLVLALAASLPLAVPRYTRSNNKIKRKIILGRRLRSPPLYQKQQQDQTENYSLGQTAQYASNTGAHDLIT